jgi:hypothetical protein
MKAETQAKEYTMISENSPRALKQSSIQYFPEDETLIIAAAIGAHLTHLSSCRCDSPSGES